MQSDRYKFPQADRDADKGMTISADNRSMQRGRRRASRTQVCRPCLVWLPEHAEITFEGVVLDLNPRGLRIRMLRQFDVGMRLQVRLMRDEQFLVPLSQPLTITVVRVVRVEDGFFDHGTALEIAKIRKAGAIRPVRATRPDVALDAANRMFTALRRNERRTGK